MKWQTTYLGTQIAVVVASDEAYAILNRLKLTSWQAGGCSILTAALVVFADAEPYHLVFSNDVVDHVVARVADGYIDADGAFTGPGIVAKHKTLEGVSTRLVRSALFPPGIPCPVAAVDELVDLLALHGVDAVGP